MSIVIPRVMFCAECHSRSSDSLIKGRVCNPARNSIIYDSNSVIYLQEIEPDYDGSLRSDFRLVIYCNL